MKEGLSDGECEKGDSVFWSKWCFNYTFGACWKGLAIARPVMESWRMVWACLNLDLR